MQFQFGILCQEPAQGKNQRKNQPPKKEYL